MKLKCPKNLRHKRFITTAHEMHEWVVDTDATFVKDLGCLEVAGLRCFGSGKGGVGPEIT